MRTYGPVANELRAAFGVECDADRMPMLLHPQPPVELRRLADAPPDQAARY